VELVTFKIKTELHEPRNRQFRKARHYAAPSRRITTAREKRPVPSNAVSAISTYSYDTGRKRTAPKLSHLFHFPSAAFARAPFHTCHTTLTNRLLALWSDFVAECSGEIRIRRVLYVENGRYEAARRQGRFTEVTPITVVTRAKLTACAATVVVTAEMLNTTASCRIRHITSHSSVRPRSSVIWSIQPRGGVAVLVKGLYFDSSFSPVPRERMYQSNSNQPN
jgi:hypothetical protein